MRTRKQALTSLRVQNFKAVKDTGILKPEGLTVFIGDNGAGKSSVIEALRFLADLSRVTLDEAHARRKSPDRVATHPRLVPQSNLESRSG